MQNQQQQIAGLFIKWLDHQTSEEENEQLMKLLSEADLNDQIIPVLQLAWTHEDKKEIVVRLSKEEIIDKILNNDPSVAGHRVAHRVHFLKTTWFRYAAAIIIILGTGAYLWNTTQKEKPSIVKTLPIEKDILPGGNKALLTLADGSTIALDSAVNGQLAVQQGSRIIKKDGQIMYDPHQQSAASVTYNTMSTPRGGTYQLTLPDGTKVWLNAASSITFPTAFVQKERIVNITGEVYFEVIKNKEKPFKVKTSTDNITVLGTSFNINAYPDEQHHKTSLLEGSVKISNDILQPGQAYVNGKVATTNLEQDLAWKNGYFNFIRADLPTVMRQLSRWYDIEVVYSGAVPFFDFKGKLPKSLTLSQILKILERMDVKFTVSGRRLIVSP